MSFETVLSADGTAIAYSTAGAGPPLVMIGGALSDRQAVTPLLPHLSSFTTVAVDRRGRGDSTDTQPYRTDRELEDITAVINQISRPVFMYGHSSGAMLALNAVAGGVPVAALVLHEPPYILDDQRPRPPADLPERLAELSARDDRGGAIRLFLSEAVRLPDAEIDALQASPAWESLLPIAHTTVYDALVSGDCRLPDPGQLDQVRQPTLIVSGGASPAWIQASAGALADALPHAESATLENQSHRADPELLAGVLRTWLAGKT